jgi:hypothetical protein
MTNASPGGGSPRSDPELLRIAKEVYKIRRLGGSGPITPEVIAKQVEGFEAGLPLEDEFAAMALWSGRCRLLQYLNQDQFPVGSRKDYQIPDFLITTDYDGRFVTYLVEVKKRELQFEKGSSAGPYMPFSRAYHQRLQNYADLVDLPLLIAWKADPLAWTLFDFGRVQKHVEAYRIAFDDVMKNNLMGVLLGDFSFNVLENSAFVLKAERLSDGDTEFEVRITDAYLENREGTRIKSIEGPFLDLFAFTSDDVEMTEEAGIITQRFYKLADEGVFAQKLLYPASHGMTDAPGPWRSVVESGFHYMLADVERSATDGIRKGFVHHILHQVPHEYPAYLTPRSGKSPSHIGPSGPIERDG